MRKPSTGQRGPDQRGLGLLEVLVAIGLVAATLGVAFQIVGGAARGTIDADRYSRAVLLAESRLAELGVTEPLRQGETYGEGGDGFQWLVAVRPMPGYQPGAASGTQQSTSLAGTVVPLVVSVTIAWGPDERPSEVTLTTLRLAPKPR